MFRNLKKEKELIDQEVELYREEQKLEIDKEIVGYRNSIIDVAKKAADDMGKMEHEYHSKQEELGIVIAKLEVQKENLEERKVLWEGQEKFILGTEDMYKEMLEMKDGEIERLSDLLDSMIEAIPEFPEINVVRK